MADDDKKSFWSSLPGILTGLAAVLTAVGALIYHNQAHPKREPEPPRQVSPVKDTRAEQPRHESPNKSTRTEQPKNPLAPPEGFMQQRSYGGNCAKQPEGSGCIHFSDGFQWVVRDEIKPRQEVVGSWENHDEIEVKGKRGRYQHILGTDYVRNVEK